MTEQLTSEQLRVFAVADELIRSFGPAFESGLPGAVLRAVALSDRLGRQRYLVEHRHDGAIEVTVTDPQEEIGVWSL